MDSLLSLQSFCFQESEHLGVGSYIGKILEKYIFSTGAGVGALQHQQFRKCQKQLNNSHDICFLCFSIFLLALDTLAQCMAFWISLPVNVTALHRIMNIVNRLQLWPGTNKMPYYRCRHFVLSEISYPFHYSLFLNHQRKKNSLELLKNFNINHALQLAMTWSKQYFEELNKNRSRVSQPKIVSGQTPGPFSEGMPSAFLPLKQCQPVNSISRDEQNEQVDIECQNKEQSTHQVYTVHGDVSISIDNKDEYDELVDAILGYQHEAFQPRYDFGITLTFQKD
ncbi:hypothetical protein NC651_026775 [Populus alba x Populus x berolinensis]|nr:hypothetical protein NC651_026775 [Populus alba x Populus x berolinensis]